MPRPSCKICKNWTRYGFEYYGTCSAVQVADTSTVKKLILPDDNLPKFDYISTPQDFVCSSFKHDTIELGMSDSVGRDLMKLHLEDF